MWGAGELEVHGVCNRSSVYRTVSLDQTIRNLTFGDVKISLVVNRLGVTKLKKVEAGSRMSWLLFGGKGEKAWYDLVCVGVFR